MRSLTRLGGLAMITMIGVLPACSSGDSKDKAASSSPTGLTRSSAATTPGSSDAPTSGDASPSSTASVDPNQIGNEGKSDGGMASMPPNWTSDPSPSSDTPGPNEDGDESTPESRTPIPINQFSPDSVANSWLHTALVTDNAAKESAGAGYERAKYSATGYLLQSIDEGNTTRTMTPALWAQAYSHSGRSDVTASKASFDTGKDTANNVSRCYNVTRKWTGTGGWTATEPSFLYCLHLTRMNGIWAIDGETTPSADD